jgi:hypothetical protein
MAGQLCAQYDRSRVFLCISADEIHELRKKEKELGIEPDWEIDAFMKAGSARGKRHSLMTDYTMRMLGLEV